MGIIITVKNANYANNNIGPFATFESVSNNVADILLSFSPPTLSLRNTGATTNYEFAASKDIKSATIIMPVGSLIPVSAVTIGTHTDGSAFVLYLDGSGIIKKFLPTGASGQSTVYTMPTNRPTVIKGSPVTITHGDTSMTITYAGYSQTIIYANISTGFNLKVIGVLVTGLALLTYSFVVNA